MKGGNNDGYDYAVGLGTVGGNDADYTAGTFFIPNLTLADLEGSDAGLRATSYGEGGEGSLKLVADYEPPAPPPPPEDHFPEWPQDISNVVFYFDTTDGDTKPKPDGDGYYTVKIDNVPSSASNDLDDWYEAAWQWIIDNDPNVGPETVLLGAAIKGGNQMDADFYALDGDTDPDPLPIGLTELVENNAIDTSYLYGTVFA